MRNLHFVSVSGGLSSAATLLRVVELYPLDDIYPVFADTNWEHPDLYRFVDDLEWFIGKPIIRLNQGKTPADISESEHMIFNSRIANCTKKLKVQPIQNYVQDVRETVSHHRAFLHIGFNMKDRYAKERTNKPYGRLPSPVANWGRQGIIVKYPLWFMPRIHNVRDYVESYGFLVPETYRIQYSNNKVFVTNNCHSGCFKAGQKYWRGMYVTFPDVFAERANWEAEMRKNPKYAEYAILTKTENGVKRAYPLWELARDTDMIIHNDKALRLQLMLDDTDSDCVDECQVF